MLAKKVNEGTHIVAERDLHHSSEFTIYKAGRIKRTSRCRCTQTTCLEFYLDCKPSACPVGTRYRILSSEASSTATKRIVDQVKVNLMSGLEPCIRDIPSLRGSLFVSADEAIVTGSIDVKKNSPGLDPFSTLAMSVNCDTTR
jgi:hypothetical protein